MKKSLLLLIGMIAVLLSSGQSYNLQQGIDAYNESEYETAINYLNQELKDNPKCARAFYFRGIIYSIHNQNSDALSDFNYAIKYFSDTDTNELADAHRLRGDIYFKIGKNDKTFTDYAEALKLTPSDPDIYIRRARIYGNMEQYNNAESDYLQALNMDDGLEDAYVGLGYTYLLQGRYSDAKKTFDQLVILDSKNEAAYYFRGAAYFHQEKYDLAIDDLFTCVLLDKTGNSAQDSFIEYSEKNYALAIAKINSQISVDPAETIWYYIRARLNENQNNVNVAIADYTKAIILSDTSDKVILLGRRAKCYSNTGMYDKSLSDYNESILLDSTNAYRYGNRGDLKRLMGNYFGALDDFTKAIEIEPLESWFYYRRGWTQEFKKYYEEALKDYDYAISIDKDYVYTYLTRGRLYETRLDNPEKAKKDYLAVLTMDTIVRKEGNCRQYALFHLGRNEEALTWLNEIIKQNPTDGNFYDAACLYSLMNRPKDAIASLETAFQNGYRDFIHLSVDDDLQNIRNLPEYKSLVKLWKNTLNDK